MKPRRWLTAAGLILAWASSGSALAESPLHPGYFTEAAPFLISTGAGHARMMNAAKLLTPAEQRAFKAKMPAFGVVEFEDECTVPNVLAAARAVPTKDFKVIVICRPAFALTVEAVVSIFLTSLSLGPDADMQLLEQPILREANKAADSFYGWQNKAKVDRRKICSPAYRAYIYASASYNVDCQKLTPAVVKVYMWNSFARVMEKETGRKLPHSDPTEYWQFVMDMTREVSEVLYDYIVLHEIAHLLNGDLDRGEVGMQEEARADDFAMKRLESRPRPVDEPFMIPVMTTLANIMIVATGAVAIESDQSDALKLRAEKARLAAACAIKRYTGTDAFPGMEKAVEKMLQRLPVSGTCAS